VTKKPAEFASWYFTGNSLVQVKGTLTVNILKKPDAYLAGYSMVKKYQWRHLLHKKTLFFKPQKGGKSRSTILNTHTKH